MTGLAALLAVAVVVLGARCIWLRDRAERDVNVVLLRLNLANGRIRYWRGQAVLNDERARSLAALNDEWMTDLAIADRQIASLEDTRTDRSFRDIVRRLATTTTEKD